jgi:hypothetical protein
MRGEIDRLALVMPPGSTKSTFASILYPAWYLARGGAAIITASHTAELAERWGRPVQASGLAHQVCTGRAYVCCAVARNGRTTDATSTTWRLKWDIAEWKARKRPRVIR